MSASRCRGLGSGEQRCASARAPGAPVSGWAAQGTVRPWCRLPVVSCRAVAVTVTASDWDFWEASAALSKGSTAPFKLSTSCDGFGSDELSSQSKCAKQPVLFLEQKYRWAAGKLSSANTVLIAVRPEDNDSSQAFSIQKVIYESLP